ncbi:MAG: DUF378 domain-containing protein [Bacilli bacterium]|nr:DUF378 domain-containing protein [Bacilli bacterium]
MNIVKKICITLIVIGALNWGLVGLFNFNLVTFIFDNLSVVISRIIFSLVGIAGVVYVVSCLLDMKDID